MRYLAILAALLPAILADPIEEISVTLVTNLVGLEMTSPDSVVRNSAQPTEKKTFYGSDYAVVGIMYFTETGVPQSAAYQWGGGSGVSRYLNFHEEPIMY
jgi:hypothetical protein